MYISLKAIDDDFKLIYLNSTNKTVAECTDTIKNFVDNFGFLDDLAPFAAKKYVTTSFEYDNDTVTLVDEPTESTGELTFSDSDTSAGNASRCSDMDFEYIEDECFNFEVDFPQIYYSGPKIIKAPANETPVMILMANTIGLAKSRRLFCVLLDSGSTVSMIKKSCLPKHAVLTELAEQKSETTLSGKLKSQQVVTMRDLRLPEFDKNRQITQQKCLEFDNDYCNYDIILGANFLRKTGIDLDYDKEEMWWYHCVLPLRPKGGLSSADFDAMEDSFYIQTEDELSGEDWLDSYATHILDAKYEYTEVRDVVEALTHVNAKQKAA